MLNTSFFALPIANRHILSLCFSVSNKRDLDLSNTSFIRDRSSSIWKRTQVFIGCLFFDVESVGRNVPRHCTIPQTLPPCATAQQI